MRGWIRGAGAALVVIAAYLLAWPLPHPPQAWDAPDAPAPAAGEAFGATEVARTGVGPEDVAAAVDGTLYTGIADGRILAFAPGSAIPATFVDTGGRPLGLAFDAAGRLLVADAVRGLLRIGPAGEIEVLYQPDAFADDVDVARDGTIWLSEASLHFGPGEAARDAVVGIPSGRLTSVDPVTAKPQVRLSGLRYANGVSVDPEQRFVLVAETFGYRIRRLWLSGPNAGTDDLLAENLPGFPDNINLDPAGHVWVALVEQRSRLLDTISNRAWLRAAVARIPTSLTPKPAPVGLVVRLDPNGSIMHTWHDPSGRLHALTSATPIGSHVYFGSLRGDTLFRAEIEP